MNAQCPTGRALQSIPNSVGQERRHGLAPGSHVEGKRMDLRHPVLQDLHGATVTADPPAWSPAPHSQSAQMGLDPYVSSPPSTPLTPYPYLPSRSQSYTSTLMVLENKQQRSLGRMGLRTDGPGGMHACTRSVFQACVQRKQPERDQTPILRPFGKDLRVGSYPEPWWAILRGQGFG